MNLTVTVYGARIFIYDFGVQWSTGQSFFRNCSTLMNATETKCLGTLIFGAPSTSGPATLNIGIKLDAYNDRLGAWYDFGPLLQQMPQSVSLHPLASSENFSQSNNPIDEYNKINSLVNFEHVQFIVDEIHQKYPGRLSVFQIAEAYTWVEEHIRYVLENPIDYWPTLSEVLGRGTANCKGQ